MKRPTPSEPQGLRFATCRRCGDRWNISVLAPIPPAGYLCPRCRNRPDERRPAP